MFQSLLMSRRFLPLFLCQFLSALTDNFVKSALCLLILFRLAAEQGQTLVPLAGAVFIAPFFILSALGGQLADAHDKAWLAERLKLAEIAVAVLACIGFVLAGDYIDMAVPVLFVALAGFGCIGALFGPVKYGILPDTLAPTELSAANALVEAGTFAAILIGTISANFAFPDDVGAPASADNSWAILGTIVVLAVSCWLAARAMPPSGVKAPGLVIDRNPLTSTFALLGELKSDKRLWVGALITSWFWLVGSVVLTLLQVVGKVHLNGTKDVITVMLLMFTVGIAIGSLAAASASQGRPNLALVPVGALLMGIFCLDLAWCVATTVDRATGTPLGVAEFFSSGNGLHMGFALFGLAAAGGLFIVPSFAAVQAWAPSDRRARVVAGCNVLNAATMTGASLLLAALQGNGVGLSWLFAGLGIACFGVLGLVLRAWGRAGVQDLTQFLFKSLFGLEVKGLENLPKPGQRAVITPNHVSYLDAAAMYSLLPGTVAFAIDTGQAQKWWIKPALRLVNAQPVDPTKPLGMRNLVQAVKDGQPLVIFPEGRISVTGGLMKVYDGSAMIADKADAVIIPVRIDGFERSKLGSVLKPSQTSKRWFPKTTITVLPARNLTVDRALRGKLRRQAAGAQLQDIMIDTAVATADLDRTLFQALVDAKATKDTGKIMLEDPLGSKLTYKTMVVGAQVLGAKLTGYAPVGGALGVMLPNSAGVAVTFFALQTIGRVPAMINFSAGPASVLAACTAAKVSCVLTSRIFIEKARLGELIAKLEGAGLNIVYLDDVRPTITLGDKLRGLRQGTRPQVIRKADDPAAILFTSGSEGTPKGVVLSHRNIIANVVQTLSRIAVNGDDKVFNVLPVFHSFGLTGGLMMPLLGGVPIYLYPSPLHYRIVPELVYGTDATILFGTDTFLNGYARSAHAYDFRSVRLIVAGAEAVKQRTRDTYMEKFGVRILEGYGVTETAPVLAVNTPMANRTGSVGRMAPLMEARLDPVPGIDEGGRLYVRGPNVMLGYYRVERPGELEPPVDGWHDTGDIVTIDAQGYIAIKGRAKRFAKIAGEMVSLSAVEAMAAEIWPGAVSVVVAEPDARKGERLTLLIPDATATREQFARHIKAKGVSELNCPAEILIDRVPLLGSGKADYVAATALVKARHLAVVNPVTAVMKNAATG
jgi:acyl-[acyl-carrier-protein]-phospholipid O-acyltransferase / long-chain-fatty-acid--[acyl-carrier-protein] ligase